MFGGDFRRPHRRPRDWRGVLPGLAGEARSVRRLRLEKRAEDGPVERGPRRRRRRRRGGRRLSEQPRRAGRVVKGREARAEMRRFEMEAHREGPLLRRSAGGRLRAGRKARGAAAGLDAKRQDQEEPRVRGPRRRAFSRGARGVGEDGEGAEDRPDAAAISGVRREPRALGVRGAVRRDARRFVGARARVARAGLLPRGAAGRVRRVHLHRGRLPPVPPGGRRAQRPRGRRSQAQVPAAVGPQHGRQVHSPPAGLRRGDPRADGLLREGGALPPRARGPRLHAPRRVGQDPGGPVDVHGRIAGDRVHPGARDAQLARDPRRARTRDGDVRRRGHRALGRRPSGTGGQVPRALRDALPRLGAELGGPRGRAARAHGLPRARRRRERRLPLQARRGLLSKVLRHQRRAPRAAAQVGPRPRGGEERRVREAPDGEVKSSFG
mmetsp:Transcript_20039/g.61734  ORF Transcript_20039/g.61734 Transcript_20039/m.61734 type:complete len:438 (+) Transcript_20039:528-1841(+)